MYIKKNDFEVFQCSAVFFAGCLYDLAVRLTGTRKAPKARTLLWRISTKRTCGEDSEEVRKINGHDNH